MSGGACAEDSEVQCVGMKGCAKPQPAPSPSPQDTYRRIVRVDLKFPDEAALSPGSMEFVRQVRDPRQSAPRLCGR